MGRLWILGCFWIDFRGLGYPEGIKPLLRLFTILEEVADDRAEGVHIYQEGIVAADAVQFSEPGIAAN
jgi:hypothetical protein